MARWILIAMLGMPATALAQDPPPTTEDADESPWGRELLRFDLGLIFSLYTAQVERGTSGETTGALANDVGFGAYGAGTVRIWGPFSAGLFMVFEAGSRESREFTGMFDPMTDATILGPPRGGSFWEYWLGPIVRAQYRAVFLEVGWAPLGIRGDSGRDDIPAVDGSTGAFLTIPSVAWLFGVGAAVELFDQLELLLRLQYRIRYYETRGGEDLADGLAHGTQDILPFIGAAYRFDR